MVYFVLIVVLCWIPFVQAVKKNVTLSLCLISRNDNLDINEWVDYHKSIGVTNIILLDNNSSVPMLHTLREHLASGFLVHYVYFTHKMYPNNQFWAYNHCLKAYRNKFNFMGFIDSDEFLVVKDRSKRITEILPEYLPYGGLALNWMNFNSNGHKTRPKGGVLANYAQCFANFHVKTIANTKYVTECMNPHFCLYNPGYYAVDTNKQPVLAAFNPANASVPDESLFASLYVNHYMLKSVEDFQIKMQRGSAAFSTWKKTPEYFQAMDAIPTKTCEKLSFGQF